MSEIGARLSERRRAPDWPIGWRIFVPILCLALSALVSIPYFFIARPHPGQSQWSLRMPGTHDMRNHYEQMQSFYVGLASGEVYPRWEEDTNRGFGAPTTSFYPPGVYYVTALCYVMAHDWTAALLWAQWLMMFASAMAIYWYARRMMSRGGAIVAMAAYLLGPYHLLDQYQRGAIAELLGFIWMPLMLGAGEQLMKNRGRGRRGAEEQGSGGAGERRKNWQGIRSRVVPMGLLGLSYGAFIWSHPPTAYQFSLAFGVAMAVLAVMKREWRGTLLIGAGLGIGVGLAAAYIIPAVLEQGLINSANVAQDYPYHDSYVLVRLGVNAGKASDFLDVVDRTWVFNAAALVILSGAVMLLKRWSPERWLRLKESVPLWILLGGLALFMMTPQSASIGKHIPGIEVGVFSWRMLGIVTFAVALLAGACVEIIGRLFETRKWYETVMSVAAALLLLAGGAWFSLEEVVEPYSNGEPFTPPAEHFNYACMPRTAYRDLFNLPRVEPAELEGGHGSVSVEHWAPQHRRLQVEVDRSDRLLIRTFSFPGWTVTIDGEASVIESGQAVRVRGANGEEAVVRKLTTPGWTAMVDGQPGEVIGEVSLGDIAVRVPPGRHEVRLDYRAAGVRRGANIATLLCLALAGIGALVAIVAKSVYA